MRQLTLAFLAILAACGSSTSAPLGDAGASTSDGSTSNSVFDGGKGGGGDGGGGGRDGGGGGDDGGASTCDCDTGTQFCLHGDVTSSGQSNVDRCQIKLGDCLDCGCYSQVGLCFEEATPESCSIVDGLIVVSCAEIQ